MGNQRFSPRNGEVILKADNYNRKERVPGFSPRNGEVILKEKINKVLSVAFYVSVPAMGK